MLAERYLRKRYERHAFDAYELLDPATLRPDEYVIQGTIAQTDLLRPVIATCLARARREGIGLIMEGSHFIPGIIDPDEFGVDLLCVLDVPNREELKARALSPNHQNRRLSQWDLERLVILQDQLLAMARRHDHPVVVNVDLDRAVKEVTELAVNNSTPG
jgi:2-phosphoglycerate kinase